ncbi:MAG: dihydroorotase [Bacteroidia bacterium]|nr:dihydroorotase [Bacteroidota bacterium]MBK7571986.1 dihydroorotase [Bacteroidota bacterium]MBK8586622.1 dihydroorotase [Bacteroidota bacterium]MBP9789284.1 dihydroorotase [Bacteroidia bacterium]MBP9922410.1 dihydroorotase [Bacteroidia bacterium]
MKSYIIKNARIVNEGKIISADVLLKNGRIEKIASEISSPNAEVINAENNFLLPGMIDDQVHFREPGLTHKGDIYTESKAAVAGGITSFMEMPNTVPNTLTQSLLQDKYDLASTKSLANYSFFMGVSNDNYDEVMRTNKKTVCGIKIFMGSSTGNMLVDQPSTLERIFGNSELLIATHCEDEKTILNNLEKARNQFGENVPMWMHPQIRSVEACYLSSSFAVALAKSKGSRLHVLHISTAKELELFDNSIPLGKKRITAEACVHHLFFDDSDYEKLGTKIKWNPAVKSAEDKAAILKGVLENKIDVIATDHAPHTLEEKSKTYFNAPSGGPLVQHALLSLMEHYHDGKITIEKIAEKTSHALSECFGIPDRGYIREGYYADLVLINPNKGFQVTESNLLYKCKWSPFENYTFRSTIEKTFVNGNLVFDNNNFEESIKGQRLAFTGLN